MTNYSQLAYALTRIKLTITASVGTSIFVFLKPLHAIFIYDF